MNETIGVSRNEGETWKDAAIRYAAPASLEAVVADSYDTAVARGIPDDEACLYACSEYSLIAPFDDDDDDDGDTFKGAQTVKRRGPAEPLQTAEIGDNVNAGDAGKIKRKG